MLTHKNNQSGRKKMQVNGWGIGDTEKKYHKNLHKLFIDKLFFMSIITRKNIKVRLEL